MIAFIATVIGEATPPSNSNTLVYLLAACLAGGGLAFFTQLILRRQTRDKLISEAADEVSTAAKAMLAEYRQELERAKVEVASLRKRVAALESQLGAAQADRVHLHQQLTDALVKLGEAEQRANDQERRTRLLENQIGQRRIGDRPGRTSDE